VALVAVVMVVTNRLRQLLDRQTQEVVAAATPMWDQDMQAEAVLVVLVDLESLSFDTHFN
jgi:hypothetical protein